ncbi:MAG: hypothetical protein LBD55_10330 [Treponema sp.]|jgi:hypothetical protein|nr:hypothetical protein [Treponema sp.]
MKKYYVIALSVLLPGLLYSACSNSAESAIQQVLGISAEAPVFLECKAISATEINFRFSLPVKVLSLNFDPPLAVESITEGDMVQVQLNREVNAGERITTDILVEDTHKNTLNVLVPFKARNDRLPSFMITELRTEYSKPKTEFVEIKTLTAGNLGALRLFIASNGIDIPVFEFPPVEVRAGEYIVIHLRSLETEIINETGGNLNASKGTEAFSESRDFWVPDAKKWLRKTDAVFFMDQDDKVLDAVVLSETPDSWESKQEVAKAVELLAKQGAWSASGKNNGSPGPADAVATKAATVTRTVCRDERITDNNRSANWYITGTSGATPGKPNNSKRYVPK